MRRLLGKHRMSAPHLTNVGLLFGGALVFTQGVLPVAVAQSLRSAGESSSESASRPPPAAGRAAGGVAKSSPPEPVADQSAPLGEAGAAPVVVSGERTTPDMDAEAETTIGETVTQTGDSATEPPSGAEHAGSGEGAAKAAPRAKPSVGRSLSVGRSNPSEPQPMFGTFEGTYVLGGLASGVSFGPRGFYLGGELSVVRQFQEFAWLGAYVDGVYDFGRDQTRLSVGPEVGWSALGLDGGYLLALDDAGAHSGVTARPLISIGFVTAYGRVSHLFEPKSTWLEAGLLLKYPFEL